MTTTAIAVINGQQIQVSNDDAHLVPIKPICQALGVSYSAQYEKLQNHPIFGNATIRQSRTVATDGKDREMVCLPLEYVSGWIFTINPNNVREEVRPNLIRYQEEYNHALFEHFFRKTQKLMSDCEAESRLVGEIDELTKAQKSIKQQISDKNRELKSIRESRLNPQPTLFD